jgi:nucleoside-diphosphate-sugar epimerase
MQVFVTGASGFIGRGVVPELVSAGHEVVGLVRSEASAERVRALGAKVLHGDLDDLDSIRAGAAAADAVIHLANKHDWAHPRDTNRAEHDAVEAIAETLVGSDRPFVVASGVAGLGNPATERDVSPNVGPDSARGGSENLALGYADRGVRVVIARFAPTVHGEGDHGFVAAIAAAARRLGSARYPDTGDNRWPAVHRLDAARLVRLGMENAPAGSVLHAVAEEGVPVRQIVQALADRLGVPTESVPAAQLEQDLSFIGTILSLDLPATSALTRRLLGWQPTGPTLLEDIAAGHYDA